MAPSYDDLSAENARLRAEIERLKALVEELRRGGKRQAAPFSKGEPQTNPQTPGRKSGPDYGTKAYRAVPPHIDEVYDAPLPETCPYCRQRTVVLAQTAQQYQTELPRRPICRQFNVAVGACTCCGRRVQGRHPLQTSDALGAAASQIGSDAQAFATMLNKELGLSHGKVARVLQALGVSLSRGGSVQVMLRGARVCKNAYQEIQLAVRRSAWVVADETGWRVTGRPQWLHAFVTELATLYLIRPSRGYDVPREALGEDFAGDMIHDGWKPYDCFTDNDHQQCNAHLLRRCHELEETARGGAVIFPRQVKALLKEGLVVRDQRDAGRMTLTQAETCAEHLEERLQELCTPKTHDGNRKLAAFLWRHWMEVFHYLRHPGLDATNWRGEQAIRPAVVNRKVWGGNRTEHGARAQEILTSVLRTAHQRTADCVTFLAALFRAPPTQRPRLLPAP